MRVLSGKAFQRALKSTDERRQQGVPFESLYGLKYASLGEIVFLDLKRSFCRMTMIFEICNI